MEDILKNHIHGGFVDRLIEAIGNEVSHIISLPIIVWKPVLPLWHLSLPSLSETPGLGTLSVLFCKNFIESIFVITVRFIFWFIALCYGRLTITTYESWTQLSSIDGFQFYRQREACLLMISPAPSLWRSLSVPERMMIFGYIFFGQPQAISAHLFPKYSVMFLQFCHYLGCFGCLSHYDIPISYFCDYFGT